MVLTRQQRRKLKSLQLPPEVQHEIFKHCFYPDGTRTKVRTRRSKDGSEELRYQIDLPKELFLLNSTIRTEATKILTEIPIDLEVDWQSFDYIDTRELSTTQLALHASVKRIYCEYIPSTWNPVLARDLFPQLKMIYFRQKGFRDDPWHTVHDDTVQSTIADKSLVSILRGDYDDAFADVAERFISSYFDCSGEMNSSADADNRYGISNRDVKPRVFNRMHLGDLNVQIPFRFENYFWRDAWKAESDMYLIPGDTLVFVVAMDQYGCKVVDKHFATLKYMAYKGTDPWLESQSTSEVVPRSKGMLKLPQFPGSDCEHVELMPIPASRGWCGTTPNHDVQPWYW